MTKIAHIAERSADKLTKSAQAAANAGADAVENGVKLALGTAEIAAEDRYETARTLTDTTEIGRMFVELIGQQTRHAMETASVFGRAVNWMDIAEAQRSFIIDSFTRMSEINASHREFLLSGIASLSRR